MRPPRKLLPYLSLLVLSAPAALAAPADDYAKPHDLILAIDVSFSMTQRFLSNVTPGKELPPSDPEGIRWDGVQFAIDIARPQDRVALVVFRGEGLVLTRYLDASGFVSLDNTRRYHGKTGREALRTLIAEVQAEEVKTAARNRDKSAQDPSPAQFDFNNLKRSALPRPEDDKLVMWSGTSVVFALEKIKEELLPRTGDDRQGVVLLFTDGFETSPFDEGDPRPDAQEEARHKHRTADYSYVRDLFAHKNNPARLGELVERWARPFRERQVPVFTFGLGEDCYTPFLEMIADKSSSRGTALPAESNHARTNVVMFDQLRRVAWELQHYWWGTPEVIVRPDEKAFRTPPLGGWHDMGVLLFSQTPAVGGLAAVAPESVTIRAVRGRAEPTALEVRASRSHQYCYLAPDSPVKAAVGPEARLEFGLKRSERDPRCYVVLSTEHPLFAYRQPQTGDARYTPKDAIPFEVDFFPDAAGIFQPDHFQVQVLVRPAAEVGRPVRRLPEAVRSPLVLTPALVPGSPRRWVFRFEQDRNDPGLVLDPDPRTKGDPDLVGPYTVDVTISGATGGPFEGYQRRLIRRTIHIKDYPALKAGVESVTLSNTGEGSAQAVLPVELDMPTARTDHTATVTARVERGPGLPGQGPLPANLFCWRQGKDLGEGHELPLFGSKGQFALELPAERWAELVSGEYEGGLVLVQAPWSREPVRVLFRVSKARYKLSARAPVFDLSQAGTEPLRQTIPVTLMTSLVTRENVALGADKEPVRNPAPRKVTFTAARDRAEVELEVRELGRLVTVAGGKYAASEGLALALAAPARLPPGRYRRTFWLTGPAVESTPVTVEVVADQPGVVVQGPDRDWIKGPDKRPRPQPELSLLGLAGTRVRRTVAFYSVEGDRTAPSRATLDAFRARPVPGDQVPVRSPDGVRERVDLDIAVPLEVEEGAYTSRLKLVDPSRQPPREAEMLVHLQVVHYGIATEPSGPVALKFAEPCAAVASAAVKAVTPAEKVPVRWWVEPVEAPELDGQPGQVLPPGLLDVKTADGLSVLGQKPKDPLFRERPLPLTIEARCAQLAPGLYHGKLRFHVREDDPRAEKDPGAPYELEVTVLVPGRRIELLAPPDPRCRVGQDAERHVRVSCYGCEPDQGAWQALGDSGKRTGPETRIQKLIRSEQDARTPGLMHHTFAFHVRPERAGKNAYQVTWLPCCRENPSEKQVSATGAVNARGLITVQPAFCSPGEPVTIEVLVDPSSVPGNRLELEVINRREMDHNPTPLSLTPSTGGRFTAKHNFDRVGEYEIRLASNGPAGLELDPVRVSAAFTLDASAELGTIEYGNGSLASLFGSKQEVSVPGAIRLTNKDGRKCRWKARLRYPVSVTAARDIAAQDPEEATSPRYDDTKHLQTRLFGAAVPETAEEGWAASGTLGDDQALELGIESVLSEPAQNEVWAGSRSHPTLNSRNGMVVEIALEWLNDAGQPVVQRTVYVPFVVGTGRGWTMLLLLGLVPVAILVGYFGWRWYRRRQRARAGRRVGTTGEDDYLGGAPHAAGGPRARPAVEAAGGSADLGGDRLEPPDTSGPPPDDLLPDYLRGN
jgi:hypothetical protein